MLQKSFLKRGPGAGIDEVIVTGDVVQSTYDDRGVLVGVHGFLLDEHVPER